MIRISCSAVAALQLTAGGLAQVRGAYTEMGAWLDKFHEESTAPSPSANAAPVPASTSTRKIRRLAFPKRGHSRTGSGFGVWGLSEMPNGRIRPLIFQRQKSCPA